MPDSLSDRYAELLTGSYDCVDRIVLNAFFRMGHAPRRFPGVVAGPDRIGGDVGQRTPDAPGGPLYVKGLKCASIHSYRRRGFTLKRGIFLPTSLHVITTIMLPEN